MLCEVLRSLVLGNFKYTTMRYSAILFFLVTISFCGQSQSTLSEQQEEKRLAIEELITADKAKLIVLVQVEGQSELKRVWGENWPENIETTYNILKNKNGLSP